MRLVTLGRTAMRGRSHVRRPVDHFLQPLPFGVQRGQLGPLHLPAASVYIWAASQLAIAGLTVVELAAGSFEPCDRSSSATRPRNYQSCQFVICSKKISGRANMHEPLAGRRFSSRCDRCTAHQRVERRLAPPALVAPPRTQSIGAGSAVHRNRALLPKTTARAAVSPATPAARPSERFAFQSSGRSDRSARRRAGRALPALW